MAINTIESPSSIKNKKYTTIAAAAALLLVALVGMTFLIHTALNGNQIGGDFYTFWMAGREYFFERQNPYSAEVTQAIQMGVYGRPAQGVEDHLGYAYPAYNLLPLLPFVALDFSWADAAWIAFNLIILLVSVLAAAPKTPRLVALTLPFFYPFTFCLLLGNFPVLFAAILFLFYSQFVFKKSRSQAMQILVGILLAWSTSKPQFMWLHLVFISLFVIRERLWPLAISFLASLAGMLVLTWAWLPGWPSMWLAQLVEYTDYHLPITEFITTSLLKSFLPATTANGLTMVLFAAFIAIAVWLMVGWWRGKIEALPVMAWAGFVIFAIDPYGYSYAQITFWIPFVLWAITQKRQTTGFRLFWIANFVITWVLFWLGSFVGVKAAVRDWPLLVYAVWLLWLLLSQAGKNSFMPSASPPLERNL